MGQYGITTETTRLQSNEYHMEGHEFRKKDNTATHVATAASCSTECLFKYGTTGIAYRLHGLFPVRRGDKTLARFCPPLFVASDDCTILPRFREMQPT
jgi:hypothetical protein